MIYIFFYSWIVRSHKIYSKPRMVHFNTQEFKQSWLKANMNKGLLLSSDMEMKHTEGRSGDIDIAQICRGGIRKDKAQLGLKLVRNVKDNRFWFSQLSFLKSNSNAKLKRWACQRTGPSDKRHGKGQVTEYFWVCVYLKSLPSGFQISVHSWNLSSAELNEWSIAHCRGRSSQGALKLSDHSCVHGKFMEHDRMHPRALRELDHVTVKLLSLWFYLWTVIVIWTGPQWLEKCKRHTCLLTKQERALQELLTREDNHYPRSESIFLEATYRNTCLDLERPPQHEHFQVIYNTDSSNS